MSLRIADVEIPDSRLAKEATELIREATDDLIYHHSRRVFLWGSLQGRNRNLAFDAELLYVGAMFHDLGLTEPYRDNDQRFEIDGADESRKFLLANGIEEDRARVVWEAIALHTTPEIPTRMAPEIALVTAGVELDVLGIGYHDVSDEVRAAVVAEHPRPDFKRNIVQAFNDGITRRPATTFGNIKADVLERLTEGYVRPNFVEIIETSPWPN
ncbi:HD domain-containing protein [Streptomyces antarcticus]|uniref:HD domain-containing protein n=1 Tax=Streptomyces antarcticus TaxID=2996458 RepID=UPI00226E370F|nr:MULTISPECIES: HD domain-containing protein [unclassified Streptomyces]MCY0944787.1 HD domain-containing protein [Streptomyces sp. H34-AA3]MCZ4081179.1 HD domain-containing protein [Streptomyces sp. H34-S5]